MAESRWASEVSALQTRQRRDYRDCVMKLHEHLQLNTNANTTNPTSYWYIYIYLSHSVCLPPSLPPFLLPLLPPSLIPSFLLSLPPSLLPFLSPSLAAHLLPFLLPPSFPPYLPPSVFLRSLKYLHCALAAAQCIVIAPVCVFVYLWVCYHDNSKLLASILTKLRL